MAIENDFLVWAPAAPSANLTDLTTYQTLSTRLAGAINGVADPLSFNRALRQATEMAAMIAQFIVQNSNQPAIDDGTTATLLANFLGAIGGFGRIKLKQNLNLYVATTGSDINNTGLTSGSPFATLQKAWNTIVTGYDLGGGYQVTVNVADGTYTQGVFALNVPTGAVGGLINANNQPGPSVSFVGNPTSPGNVIINVANGNCFHAGVSAQISINGFKLLAGGTSSNYNQNGCGMYAFASGGIVFNNINFGVCSGAHIVSTVGSVVEGTPTAQYSITGSAPNHILVYDLGYVTTAGATVNVGTGVAFSSAFVSATNIGLYLAATMTFTGSSATGPQWIISTNGLVNTGGHTTAYFPGNTAGATPTSGGQLV